MLVSLLVLALFAGQARALVLTSYFETVLVPSVTTSWTTVTLDNSYSNAIPICTNVLSTFAGSAGNYVDPPAVPRIRNIGASSFELRIQGWEDTAANPNDVHCIIMDEGAHTLPDGRQVEAHSVESDGTNGQSATDGGWDLSLMEDVSATVNGSGNSYTNPAVFAQVISHNDNRASTAWVTNCAARTQHPFSGNNTSGICVGKHVGQITTSRNPETVGYIVAESGSGTVNNVFYELALGSDSIAGNNAANTGDSYGLTTQHTMAVLTMAAIDGGNGGWAVLYGNNPLSTTALELVIDEEVFEQDTSRNHTSEQVYYWAFSGARITLVKNIVNDGGGTLSITDFVLAAQSTSDSVSGVSGSADVTSVIVQPGNYDLSETVVPGYSASSWSCVGDSGISDSIVRLAAGDDATCTITNDDQSIDLSIAKSVNNLAPNIGETLTFTLLITNTGPDSATDLNVMDPLPAGFSYVAASISGGDVRDDSSPSGTGLDWTINSLAAGASTSLTFQATVLTP